MTGLFLPIVIVLAALGLSWPLGRYLRWAMDPSNLGVTRQRYERTCGLVLGRLATKGQSWKAYCLSLLTFNAVMFALAYFVLMVQQHLPLNPDGMHSIKSDLAFNTAASFTANTNLQHYSGEATMSYFSQLFALMWLQFVSAATGIAALAALSRGLAGRVDFGNFYRDAWRATGLILLPLALIWAVLLAACGVPMTFDGSVAAQTLEEQSQTIARGPVAAFVAIKQLGTNGGGFFGPNSTHPLENPSFSSNVLSSLAILILPMASVWMFGRITGRLKHAGVVFGVMLAMNLAFVSLACFTESQPTAALAGLPVECDMNWEGKELRFGAAAGPFWAASTTATSNGSVNAMHDSLNPLTGLVALGGMWLNVIFGGVGVGLVNMFVFIITAVFLSGMMVGRTPEYLNRKVETREMKLAFIALLAHPLFILGGAALFAATSWGRDTISNPGSHGFSEIVYEFTSAAANNGSGFEGLADNTLPWNIATGLVMLLARYIPIIAPLAIAGSLAAKKATAETAGTFRTDTPTFGLVLAGTVVIVGALLFLPLAMLGPVAEHLQTRAESSHGWQSRPTDEEEEGMIVGILNPVAQNHTQECSMELLYEEETHILRRCLFDVQNEVGIGRCEECYQQAAKMWLEQNGVPVISRCPYRLLLSGQAVHTLFPDLVAWDKITLELLAVAAMPIAPSFFHSLRLPDSQLDCLIVEEALILSSSALFDSNNFNISRGLSFMKSLGVPWGIAANFGKSEAQFTGLRISAG